MSFLLNLGDLLVGGKEPIDDNVDKIHRKCTIVFLLLLALPLFTKQFAGEPIECFTPTYFTDAQSRYVNSYCWTVSTFYHTTQQGSSKSPSADVSEQQQARINDKSQRVHTVDYEEFDLPDDSPPVSQQPIGRVQTKVNYYQWAPMILLAKALTFYVPFALWKALAHSHGVSVRKMMKRVGQWATLGPNHPDRTDMFHDIINQIHIMIQRTPTPLPVAKHPDCGVDCAWLWARLGGGPHQSRLFVIFLGIKILYFANLFFQFYLLVTFLGEDYLTHGLDILSHLWRKREWWTSPRFPLQTLCSVRAAQQGSLRQYQCHCVLPINLFNEKICSIW